MVRFDNNDLCNGKSFIIKLLLSLACEVEILRELEKMEQIEEETCLNCSIESSMRELVILRVFMLEPRMCFDVKKLCVACFACIPVRRRVSKIWEEKG